MLQISKRNSSKFLIQLMRRHSQTCKRCATSEDFDFYQPEDLHM